MKRNRSRQAAFWLLLFSVLHALYCVNNSVVDSGGGLDIGNPTKISVVDSLNRPVAHASVKILPSEAWFTNTFSGNDLIADSATTDKSGLALFDSLAEGNYNLQVDHASGGAFIRGYRKENSGSVTAITIRRYGSVSGKISSDSGTPVLITMEGTAYSTKVNQDGSYAFSDIPEGECFPVIMDIDSQWTFAHTVAVISSEASVNNEEVSFGSLLIDDFEDSANTRRVGRFVDYSYIYAMHEDVDSASAAYRIVSGGIGGGNALE
ncbi:MAG: carboxypeptidase regulatory-like domain-containing protein, partial [Chitinispirillaceae bacterium]|nr:carboxypeptidase regulatory-like domain-containing protein [Chitinispirillaceae bacterium]